MRPHPVVEKLGLPLTDRGRIVVDETMRVQGREDVWAIGDAAAVPDPAKKGQEPTPPTCQHALRQGRRVAENVAATLGSGKRAPVHLQDARRVRRHGPGPGGGEHRRDQVARRGSPGCWRARYHLAMMPGFKRKLRLLVDWNVQLLFGRDLSELGRLGHAASLGDPSTAGGTKAGERPTV